MDSPLSTLAVAIFFGFIAVIVKSQGNVSPPPPRFSAPPLPPPSPPPVPPPPPPLTPPSPLTPPPPARPHPLPRKRLRPPPPGRGDHNHPHKHLSPPSKKEKLNTGKKVGLMFIGVAAILQVCAVTLLLISRRQLLKAESAY